jgi:ABC-2 type transport system ATP-binding protein
MTAVATARAPRPAHGHAAGLAIETRGLTKHYRDVRAVDDLDLAVPEGSVYGFLGPNGAGKTTTLRMLTGLALPTAGSATVAGIPVRPGDARLSRAIGYLDQDPRFYGWMRGRELLELVGRLDGADPGSMRVRIDEVLELVGLADAGSRRIGGYSGGMRQRIGLAAALVARPRVLFLDEPVSALDPQGRHDVLEIIGRLRGTSTVFMSTHILNDVERVCDEVAILDHGRLVAAGPLAGLLERYARPVYRLRPERGQEAAVASLAERLAHAPWVVAATAEHGEVRVHVRDTGVAGRALLHVVDEAGIELEAFERQRPSLEDVFLQLVGSGAGARPSGQEHA